MNLRWHREDRSGLLLGALVAALMFSPYVNPDGFTRYIFNGLLTLVMVSGALAAARTHGRAKLVAVVIAVALLGAFLLAHSKRSDSIAIIRILEILFLLAVGGSVLGQVMGPGRVNLDKIFAAISVYLLAGLILGLACELLESLVPGSYGGNFVGQGVTGSDMMYFGFVTLTTLGYGDIVPLTAKARSLAMLGAIAGPLYIAILVSRLVSAFEYSDEADAGLS